MAARLQAMAASRKPMVTDGPALVAATLAPRVKMPAPMTTATPKTVRSRAERFRLSLWLGSSVSCIDCSTDLVRNSCVIAWLPSLGHRMVPDGNRVVLAAHVDAL